MTMASNEYDRQLEVVRSAVQSLPEGIVRTHMQLALDGLRGTIQAVSVQDHSVSSERTQSSGNDLVARLARRVESAAPTIAVTNENQALVLAVHLILLDAGLACTGTTESDATGATSGFAAPIRPIPEAQFVPAGWQDGDGSSFNLRYCYPASTRGPITTILLSAMSVGSALALTTRTTGRPPLEAALEFDTREYAKAGCAGVASCLAPLSQDVVLTSALVSRVKTCLLHPLIRSAESEIGDGAGGKARSTGQGDGRGLAVERPHVSRYAPPSGPLPGIPFPLTGGRTDFDRDLMPDFHGAVPGGFIGGGRDMGPGGPGGMQVGPGHPLFGPIGPGQGGLGGMPGMYPGGGGGGLPPGVPPGARFDPFGPPGVFPGTGEPGGPRGLGTGRGGFGPNPDHLRPPRNGGDIDPPPDIYW